MDEWMDGGGQRREGEVGGCVGGREGTREEVSRALHRGCL